MGVARHGQHDDCYTAHRRSLCWFLSLVLLCLTSTLFPRVGHSAPPRLIEDIRFRSTHDATRVVIELNGPVVHTVGRLTHPSRLFIDLRKTRLAPNWERRSVHVADGRLQTIRLATNRPGVVRIVLDFATQQDYHVFILPEPYRVVVDLHKQATTSSPPPPTPQTVAKQAPATSGPRTPVTSKLTPVEPKLTPVEPQPAAAVPQPTPAARPTIVIDPGHGGKDPGAIGHRGLREKHVVLEIAKALRQVIRTHLPHYRVVMTRERDVFVPLDTRTRIANKHQARVFISIHANASPNHQARGIETWYLSFSANERAKRTAARENNMSASAMSELERILLDLRETDRINQSAILAGMTQTALVKRTKAHYQHLPSRGVEGAPFIVLLNTSMPSILVEVAFVSNKYDERLLRRQAYQRTLAEGIFRGIRTYLHNAVVKAD